MVRQRERASFRSVLAVAEFRWMWIAELLSIFGDQLARVALAVLVFDSTHSAALTGLAYALTYLPMLLGASLLAGLGDRYPRRTVMVTCDVLSAVLVGCMAIPGSPLVVLCALLVVLTVAGGPFRGAQQAMLPEILLGEHYVTGLSIRSISTQGAQLLGFAVGGAVIGVINPYWALAADSATFVLSALLVAFGVRHRPAARSATAARPKTFDTAAIRLLWRDHASRLLLALKLLAACYILPEGLASPFAAKLGEGPLAVGLIMAADPLGSVIGAFLFARCLPVAVRNRSMTPFAICGGLALALPLVHPSLVIGIAGFALSGAFSAAYQIHATVSMTRVVPNTARAGALGLTNSSMIAVQGLGVAVGGVVAEVVGPIQTIALGGVLGALLACAATPSWNRLLATRSELAQTD